MLPTPQFRVGRIRCYVADRLLNRLPHYLCSIPLEYILCTGHIFNSSSQWASEVDGLLPTLQVKRRPVNSMARFTVLVRRTDLNQKPNSEGHVISFELFFSNYFVIHFQLLKRNRWSLEMICILKFFVSIHFGFEIYFLTEVFCHATKLWLCPFPGAGHTWKNTLLFSRIPLSSEEQVVNEGHVILLHYHMNSQSHRARLWEEAMPSALLPLTVGPVGQHSCRPHCSATALPTLKPLLPSFFALQLW